MNRTRKQTGSPLGRVGLGLLVALIPALVGVSSFARPETLGLQLAIPSNNVPLAGSDSLLDANGPDIASITLTIDTAGKVAVVAPDNVISVRRLSVLERYFSKVNFLSARKDGKPVKSRLAVEAVLTSEDRACVVRYPISADSNSGDQLLYSRSLTLNGIVPASWRQFPWFHAGLNAVDTTYLLRYALISLGLSPKGRVIRADLIGTNYPGYADQVTSAAKYGVYSPAKRGTKDVSSDNLLLITFFPTVSYPTQPLDASRLDSVSWHNRYLVRMMPDSVGLMTEPVPRQPSPSSLRMIVPAPMARRSTLMSCNVDTVGKIEVSPIGVDTTGTAGFCQKIREQIRLYPAMDFHGRPQPFRGILHVTNQSEGIIRIKYLWLK